MVATRTVRHDLLAEQPHLILARHRRHVRVPERDRLPILDGPPVEEQRHGDDQHAGAQEEREALELVEADVRGHLLIDHAGEHEDQVEGRQRPCERREHRSGLDRPRPVRTVPPQEQEPRERQHVTEDVADVRDVEDHEVVRAQQQQQADVHHHVDRHPTCRDVELVQVVQPLDRHVVAGDAVEGAASVGRRRVHREDQARDQADHGEPAERGAGDLLQSRDVEAAVVADRSHHAAQAERQEEVDEQREHGHALQRLGGVPLRVVVLGREARAHLDPVRGPAHDEEPHQRDPEVAEAARVVEVLEVRRLPVPGEVGEDDEDRERNHQQRSGHVPHRQRWLDPEHVEEPDPDDHDDRDRLRQPEVREPEVEVGVVHAVARLREPLGDDEGSHDVPDEREHDGPADPIPERRDRTEEVETRPPALVRVEGDPAGLVGEHRGGLRVDEVLQQPDGRGDPPEEDRSPRPDRGEREAERPQEERRLAQADDESVVPVERLEEMAFLDGRLRRDLVSHLIPPLCVRGPPAACRGIARHSEAGNPGDVASDRIRGPPVPSPP